MFQPLVQWNDDIWDKQIHWEIFVNLFIFSFYPKSDEKVRIWSWSSVDIFIRTEWTWTRILCLGICKSRSLSIEKLFLMWGFPFDKWSYEDFLFLHLEHDFHCCSCLFSCRSTQQLFYFQRNWFIVNTTHFIQEKEETNTRNVSS